MQNENNRQSRFMRFLKQKGYYMALALCLVAVGVAGWIFVSNAMKQQSELDRPALSVPGTVVEPEKEDPQKPVRDTGAEEAQSDTPVLGDAEVAEKVDDTTIRPVSGSVTQDHAMDRLAYNPTTKDWRVHNGIDLAATEGQTVLAARAGTVTAVYEDESYGNTVIIRHDGFTTHYANLSTAAYVKAGDEVKAGDIIGTVGSSAMLELAQEPHLHFEVYRGTEPVDPEDFLS